MKSFRSPWHLRTVLLLLGFMLGACAIRAQTPLNLFNGTSLLGWNPHGTWSATAGILATNGGGNRNVLTAVPFADLRLEFEYNETAPMGAKLRLWATHEDTGGLSIDLDTMSSPAGVGGVESLSHSSLSTVAPGWHRVQVEASHGQLSTRVDGQPSGNAGDLGTRAGYLGFEASGDGALQVRNIRLTPLNLSPAFNGTDLSGWKAVARGPDAKGGVGHTVEKTFTFGIGGGSAKPHEAKWNVLGGNIHGEDGPGGLENSTPIEDGIVQITSSMRGDPKPENMASVAVRNAPGQLGGGYRIGIGPYAGGVEGIVKHNVARGAGPVDETFVIAGRTVAIWVNGTLTTVHTDTRPESSNTGVGAKTSGGSLSLVLPNGGEQLDVHRIATLALPRNYGVAARAPAPLPPPPVTAPVAVAAPAASAGASETEKALLAQQQAAAKKDASDQANKQRVASLMSQGLAATDPQQQMAAYGQVVQIDPSNAAAVQGFKEAQAKVQAQQAAQQNAVTAQADQQQEAQTRGQQTDASVKKSEAAFLAGHFAEASAALSVAERLSPGNPAVRDLRSRISSAQSVRSRLYFLGGGVGLMALLSALALWLRRRKQMRYPVLEVTRGFETGRTYSMEKDLTRIGAVAQNGGQKNDIVIQDVEHAISRFHCEVARKNGQLYVTDLKSSNGTRLNGELLQPGRPELLRSGNTITLANNVDLRFGFDRRAKNAN